MSEDKDLNAQMAVSDAIECILQKYTFLTRIGSGYLIPEKRRDLHYRSENFEVIIHIQKVEKA